MRLSADEFLRRFLIHILPSRFHRIRHYGFLSNTVRAEQLKKVRDALNVPQPVIEQLEDQNIDDERLVCKSCCGEMRLIEVFEGTLQARAPPRVSSL